MHQLCIASKNKGKIAELRALPALQHMNIIAADAYPDVPAPEENGADFHENAFIKATYYSKATGLPALADDSGLCVQALGGAPGLHSARYAEEAGGIESAFIRLQNDIAASATPDDFSAAFICVLCLYLPDGSVRHYEGETKGTLVFPPRGDSGFGYDPIFKPEGYDSVFAELGPTVKATESHRAKALRLFAKDI